MIPTVPYGPSFDCVVEHGYARKLLLAPSTQQADGFAQIVEITIPANNCTRRFCLVRTATPRQHSAIRRYIVGSDPQRHPDIRYRAFFVSQAKGRFAAQDVAMGFRYWDYSTAPVGVFECRSGVSVGELPRRQQFERLVMRFIENRAFRAHLHQPHWGPSIWIIFATRNRPRYCMIGGKLMLRSTSGGDLTFRFDAVSSTVTATRSALLLCRSSLSRQRFYSANSSEAQPQTNQRISAGPT